MMLPEAELEPPAATLFVIAYATPAAVCPPRRAGLNS